jgi:putative heme-binding domain-containing protein
LGPRLEGIASRFGRDDIFRSIVLPNEQVPDRYRAVMIETVDGQVIQGSVVYQSVEGVTLQESSGNTVRINRGDIESRSVSKNSLMPEGLLNDASGQDWADLYAYLKKL